MIALHEKRPPEIGQPPYDGSWACQTTLTEASYDKTSGKHLKPSSPSLAAFKLFTTDFFFIDGYSSDIGT